MWPWDTLRLETADARGGQQGRMAQAVDQAGIAPRDLGDSLDGVRWERGGVPGRHAIHVMLNVAAHLEGPHRSQPTLESNDVLAGRRWAEPGRQRRRGGEDGLNQGTGTFFEVCEMAKLLERLVLEVFGVIEKQCRGAAGLLAPHQVIEHGSQLSLRSAGMAIQAERFAPPGDQAIERRRAAAGQQGATSPAAPLGADLRQQGRFARAGITGDQKQSAPLAQAGDEQVGANPLEPGMDEHGLRVARDAEGVSGQTGEIRCRAVVHSGHGRPRS